MLRSAARNSRQAHGLKAPARDLRLTGLEGGGGGRRGGFQGRSWSDWEEALAHPIEGEGAIWKPKTRPVEGDPGMREAGGWPWGSGSTRRGGGPLGGLME